MPYGFGPPNADPNSITTPSPPPGSSSSCDDPLVGLSIVLTLATCPLWIPKVAAFIAAHKTLTATAFWKYIKDRDNGKSRKKAARAAGIDFVISDAIEHLVSPLR